MIPSAPAIGGDAYEVEEWLAKVEEYFAHDDYCKSEGVMELRRAFWDANPETEPVERKRAREERDRRERDRKLERHLEIRQMKDPAWIFGKDDR